MKNNVTIVNPMQENKILWTSKNGRWTIEQLSITHSNEMMVLSLMTFRNASQST